jgi:hypothetical protein
MTVDASSRAFPLGWEDRQCQRRGQASAASGFGGGGNYGGCGMNYNIEGNNSSAASLVYAAGSSGTPFTNPDQIALTGLGYNNQEALAAITSGQKVSLAGIDAHSDMFTLGTNAQLQAQNAGIKLQEKAMDSNNRMNQMMLVLTALFGGAKMFGLDQAVQNWIGVGASAQAEPKIEEPAAAAAEPAADDDDDAPTERS